MNDLYHVDDGALGLYYALIHVYSFSSANVALSIGRDAKCNSVVSAINYLKEIVTDEAIVPWNARRNC